MIMYAIVVLDKQPYDQIHKNPKPNMQISSSLRNIQARFVIFPALRVLFSSSVH